MRFKIIQNIMDRIAPKRMDYSAGLEWKLENPDKFLAKKNKDLTFYDTMMTDDRIESSIKLRKKCVLGTGYEISGKGKAADFIRDMFKSMEDMSLRDLIECIMEDMVYGFKAGEKVFDVDGSLIYLKKVAFRHSVFFDFDYDEYGDLKSFHIGRRYGESIMVEGREAIFNKFLISIYPYLKNGNYYGESELVEVYPQYYAKTNIFRYRNIFLQNFGAPIPNVIYNEKATSAGEKAAMQGMLDNFQNQLYFLQPGVMDPNKGILIPKFSIDLIEKKGTTSTEAYENSISQLDKQISRKILIPDKIGYTDSDGGSYAMSQTQSDIFQYVLRDQQIRVEQIINGLIRQVVDYNFTIAEEEYPKLVFSPLERAYLSGVINSLIQNGVVDPEEEWVRPYLGIPKRDPGFIPEEKEEKEEIEVDVEAKKEYKIFSLKKKDFFAKVKANYEETEDEFLAEYTRVMAATISGLVQKVQNKKIVENQDIKAVNELKINKGEIRDLYASYLIKLYIQGKGDASWEVKKRIGSVKASFEIEDEYLDRKYIEKQLAKYGELAKMSKRDRQFVTRALEKAYMLAGDKEKEMVSRIFFTVEEGIRSGEPLFTTISKIESFLADDAKKNALTIARTSQSSSYNEGRMNLFQSPDVDQVIEAYQYSAVIDDATTPFCSSHNGQVIASGDPALTTMNPPNHFNCRSLWIPIFIGEGEIKDSEFYNWREKLVPFGTDVPAGATAPAKGFGGF